MGASGSVPRTLSFDNPNPIPDPEPQRMPLVITQNVVDRIEGKRAAEEFNKQNAEPVLVKTQNDFNLHTNNMFLPNDQLSNENEFIPTPPPAAEQSNDSPTNGSTKVRETEIIQTEDDDGKKNIHSSYRYETDASDSMEKIRMQREAFQYVGSETPFPTSNVLRKDLINQPNPKNDLKVNENNAELINIHESSFEESFGQIEKILGKTHKWQDEFSGYIKEQKEKLIQCYKSEQMRESFECEQLARDFQKHVLDMQYKTLNDRQ